MRRVCYPTEIARSLSVASGGGGGETVTLTTYVSTVVVS